MTKTQVKDAAEGATVERLAGEVEAAVVAVEQLEAGAVYAEPAARAGKLLDELRAQARAILFPAAVVPIGADVIADIVAYSSRDVGAAYGVGLAQLHGAALVDYPKLAAALRTPAYLANVRRAGANAAVVQDPHVRRIDAERRAGEEAVDAYQTTIAAQLAAAGQMLPHSAALAAVPALKARLDAAVSRLEEHARADAERIEREQREADEAMLQARRDSLVAFFTAQFQTTFDDVHLGDWPATGQGLAEVVRRGAFDLERGEAIRDRYVERVRRQAEGVGLLSTGRA